MIVVTIEHAPSNWWAGNEVQLVSEEAHFVLSELSDNIEAITGLVFSEELDRVDVRVRPFGPYDQYDEPLFITIDVEEEEMHNPPQALADQFGVHLNQVLTAITNKNITFRVWVRRIVGAYHESP